MHTAPFYTPEDRYSEIRQAIGNGTDSVTMALWKMASSGLVDLKIHRDHTEESPVYVIVGSTYPSGNSILEGAVIPAGCTVQDVRLTSPLHHLASAYFGKDPAVHRFMSRVLGQYASSLEDIFEFIEAFGGEVVMGKHQATDDGKERYFNIVIRFKKLEKTIQEPTSEELP